MQKNGNTTGSGFRVCYRNATQRDQSFDIADRNATTIFYCVATTVRSRVTFSSLKHVTFVSKKDFRLPGRQSLLIIEVKAILGCCKTFFSRRLSVSNEKKNRPLSRKIPHL